MPDRKQDDEWVTVARLTRPWGRRGELAADSWSGHPERFQELQEVTLFGAEGFPEQPRRLTVLAVWEHGNRFIFKFEGVDSISAAEELKGAEIRIPAGQRLELPEGEYYQSDLIGCEVFDRDSGRRLGQVTNFLEAGPNGVLQIERSDGRELLIPFAREICVEIDVAHGRVGVNLPEGLAELND